MKLYVTGLAFAIFLGLTSAAPSPTEIIEDRAIQECNATILVQRNPRTVIGTAIATGGRIKLSQEEKKVKFLDDNANIRNGPGLVNYTLRQVPEIAKYSDVIIAQVFQIARSAKGFDEKCHKAFAIYHQYGQCIFTLAVADGVQTITGVKDKIVNSIENGQPIDEEITHQVKHFLTFFHEQLTSFAKESQN